MIRISFSASRSLNHNGIFSSGDQNYVIIIQTVSVLHLIVETVGELSTKCQNYLAALSLCLLNSFVITKKKRRNLNSSVGKTVLDN